MNPNTQEDEAQGRQKVSQAFLDAMTDEELERAGAIETGDDHKVYAVGRKHERDDVIRELRLWKALTGNRKVDELIARIEKGQHAAAGSRAAHREARKNPPLVPHVHP